MNLTTLEAKLLGVMSGMEPVASLSVRQLLEKTGGEYKGGTVRRALRGMSCRGLVIRSDQAPARWRIAGLGKTAINDPQYRDYLPTRAAS